MRLSTNEQNFVNWWRGMKFSYRTGSFEKRREWALKFDIEPSKIGPLMSYANTQKKMKNFKIQEDIQTELAKWKDKARKLLADKPIFVNNELFEGKTYKCQNKYRLGPTSKLKTCKETFEPLEIILERFGGDFTKDKDIINWYMKHKWVNTVGCKCGLKYWISNTMVERKLSNTVVPFGGM